MSTKATLNPQSAGMVGTLFPSLGRDSQNRWYLAFDAAQSEVCEWQFVAPQGLTGTLTAYFTFRMASATSGGIRLQVSVEAITPGDSVDTDAASSFDTENGASNTSLPGTAGYVTSVSVTLTNDDGIAAGDIVRIRAYRDHDHGDDTATGDMQILGGELRDAA